MEYNSEIQILSNRSRKSTARRHICRNAQIIWAASPDPGTRCVIHVSIGPVSPWIIRIWVDTSSPWAHTRARRLQLLQRETAKLPQYNSFLTHSQHQAHNLQRQSKSFWGSTRFRSIGNMHFAWRFSLCLDQYLILFAGSPDFLIMIDIGYTICNCCNAYSFVLYMQVLTNVMHSYILSFRTFPSYDCHFRWCYIGTHYKVKF